MQKITINLWFDSQAEEAAKFYTGIFKNSRITNTAYYGSAGPLPEGTVMIVEFALDGMSFTALNGGPAEFKFNEAISLVIHCESQEEVDHFWEKLLEGGGTENVCGWLKDRYGVSWQVVPTAMNELIGGPDPEKSQRAMAAMLKMQKIDIEALRQAYDG